MKIKQILAITLTALTACSTPKTEQLGQPWTEGAFETRAYRYVFADMGYSKEEIDA